MTQDFAGPSPSGMGRPKRRILLVEDEKDLVTTLSDRLTAEGYVVDAELDGESGYVHAAGSAYDLVILDVMLPKKDGLEVCRDLRAGGVSAPVLMLTARGELTDRVAGLKIGADDYLVKPFEMPELLARLEALLRRSPRLVDGQSDSFSFGEVRVDFRSSTVFKGNAEIALAAQEFRLLSYFIMHRGESLSRNVLLDAVWGYDRIPSTRTVDVHVAWLRQKLEDNPSRPRHIITLRGMGYKFVA